MVKALLNWNYLGTLKDLKQKKLDDKFLSQSITNGVYMFLDARKIISKKTWKLYTDNPMYIGQVSGRAIIERLKEHLNDDTFKCMSEKQQGEILIKVAEIIPTSQKTLSKRIIDAVECCLIKKTQSICNGCPCKINYSKKIDIRVQNSGKIAPLKRVYYCYANYKNQI